MFVDKPIVVADVSWLHAAPGLHAELMCRVGAEPAARVEWWYQGEPVDSDSSSKKTSYIQGRHHVLQFKNVTAEDFGIYTCKAVNSEGLSEATVELSGRFNAPKTDGNGVSVAQLELVDPA